MAELSVEVRVVMCTQNEGKLTEVRKYFEARQTAAAGGAGAPSVRFVVVSPSEAGLPQVEVDEDQPTLEGNAAKKARQHYRLLPPSAATPTGPCPDQRSMTVVVADDTSLAIETLNGEPGIKVRRWKDGITSMTDEGIITHCLARMQGHSNRKVQFRSVVAMVKPGGAVPEERDEEPEVEFFDGLLDGTILEEADPMRIAGFPMESLFYVDEYSLLLGTIQLLPPDEKLKYPTHRQRLLDKLYARLVELALSSPPSS